MLNTLFYYDLNAQYLRVGYAKCSALHMQYFSICNSGSGSQVGKTHELELDLVCEM